MKKFVSVALAGAIILSAGVFCPAPNFSTVAEEFIIPSYSTYGMLEYKIIYDSYVVISGCDKEVTEVVIPTEIDGMPVTRIESMAFYNCKNLTSITIPDSITEIGDYAFSGTPWLENKQKENPFVIVNNILVDGTAYDGENVVIPDSVTTIAERAFALCSKIVSVIIPDSVTKIGESAFTGCSSLKSVNIPNSVTEIESETFYGNALESFSIPDSIKVIGNEAFGSCYGLKSVEISESVEKIDDQAFLNCYNLESITIPESVKEIGGNAFFHTAWLETEQEKSPLVICNGILIDGKNCTGDVIVPDVNSIANNAFQGSETYTSVVVPESVLSIGREAFCDCSNLESITIKNPECNINMYQDTICNYRAKNLTSYEFNGTIYGYPNSTAQAYAEKYGYKFEPIGEQPPTEETETLYGDANLDGDVTIADSVAILQYLANADEYPLTEQGLKNADVLGDDGVNTEDALQIQKLDAGVIDKL